MFCPKCGKEVADDAVVCIHCGRSLKEEPVAEKPESKDYNQPKTGMGVLFGLLLGLIGLVIGIVMYPEGTEARKTFMKGWLIAFCISVGFSVLMSIIIFLLPFSFASFGA